MRADLGTYEAAGDETGLAPPPNNCGTPSYPFTTDVQGYLRTDRVAAESLSGFGVYRYESTFGQLTTITLAACGEEDEELPSISRVLTLNFYGIDRVEPGTYPVTRSAESDGGFVVAFTDNDPETSVNCNDLPTGTVEITEGNFEVVSGSFDVTVRCIDETLLPPTPRIPRETRFVGTFSAKNVGVE